MVLAMQQQTMMTSFQQMFMNVLASHATTADAAAAGNHSMSDYSCSKMHLNDLDLFDGLPKNTESFINSCVNIFMAQPQLYLDTESQVCFPLLFLKSGALKWCNSMLHDIKNGTYVITDWNDFKQQLWVNFGNKHLVEEAQCALHNIHQGSCMAKEFSLRSRISKPKLDSMMQLSSSSFSMPYAQMSVMKSIATILTLCTTPSGRKQSFKLTKISMKMQLSIPSTTPIDICRDALPPTSCLETSTIISNLPYATLTCCQPGSLCPLPPMEVHPLPHSLLLPLPLSRLLAPHRRHSLQTAGNVVEITGLIFA